LKNGGILDVLDQIAFFLPFTLASTYVIDTITRILQQLPHQMVAELSDK
jgi:hypothetical protein